MVAMPGRDRWGTIPAMVDDPTDVLARLEAALAKLDELRDTPLPCARIRAELLALPCQVLREQVESTARLARAAKAAVGQVAPAVAAAAMPQRLRAARARFADDHEDIVDRDAGGAAGENWRADLQPFAAEVEDAAEEAAGFDDFLRKLGKRTVDGDKLVRNLATATMQLRGVGDGTDEVE